MPSAFYQYTFDRNPDWSRFFSRGGEIHHYFRGTVDRFGIGKHIVLGVEVTGAEFAGGRWCAVPHRPLGPHGVTEGQAGCRGGHRLDGGADRQRSRRDGAGAGAVPAHPAVGAGARCAIRSCGASSPRNTSRCANGFVVSPSFYRAVQRRGVQVVTEVQADYALAWIQAWQRGEFTAVAPTREATERYNAMLRAAMSDTIWTSGCQSWYLGKDGVPEVWPFSPQRHARMLRDRHEE